MDRRTFLAIAAHTGGSLLINVSLVGCATDGRDTAPTGSFEANAWVRIDPDGTISLGVDRSEMGQGVMTGLATLLAEELDVDLANVRVAFVTGRADYASPHFGIQITSASSSTRDAWERLRHAGATARAMLIAAAAKRWNVPASSCTTLAGLVLHADSGRSLPYGALAPLAASLAPVQAEPKKPSEFRLIGRAVHRLDTGAKVTGAAVFGQDVALPGLLTAVVARPPSLGATLLGYDDRLALAVPGVRAVQTISSGVAVIADGFWEACKGRDALRVEWRADPSAGERDSTVAAAALRRAVRAGAARTVLARGDYPAVRDAAAKLLSAEYEIPYQAHATMEPMCCVAHVTGTGCDVWVPTQNPEGTRLVTAELTGLPLKHVRVNVTFLGGGFGRRQETDFVVEAVELSQALARPIKVMWSREDDIRHDFYRPAAHARVEASLDLRGRPIGWHYRVATTSVWKRIAPRYAELVYLRGLPVWARTLGRNVVGAGVALATDPNIAEGAEDFPYAADAVLVDYAEYDPRIPVGPWRSVGYAANVFAIESFVDEVARVSGDDPLRLRLSLVERRPRLAQVLQVAAARSGWSAPRPHGSGVGLACYECLGTFVAMAAVVETGGGGGAWVKRIVCALDCGRVINPAIVTAQVEGAVAFGLGATLKHAITVREGRVEQGNFDDYPLLRSDEMPEVETHIVASEARPTGVGEVAVPGVAPAVCNALCAATGQRVRRLPVDMERFAAS
jgi:CO/xanthine dehydrogenase Mo-binding subunit